MQSMISYTKAAMERAMKVQEVIEMLKLLVDLTVWRENGDSVPKHTRPS